MDDSQEMICRSIAMETALGITLGALLELNPLAKTAIQAGLTHYLLAMPADSEFAIAIRDHVQRLTQTWLNPLQAADQNQ